MSSLFTTAQVAELLRVSPRRVQQKAQKMGLKPHMIAGRSFIWTEDHVELLRPLPRGRPLGSKKKRGAR